MLKKYLLLSCFAVVALFGLIVYEYGRFYDGALHVVFCDVGQGDAILIRTPKGQSVLIDGGPDSSIVGCLSEFLPFWDRDIELMILTHPHADHATGLISVLERYSVLRFATEEIPGTTAVYTALVEMLQEKQIAQQSLYQGDTFTLDTNVRLHVVWPTREWMRENKAAQQEIDLNQLSVSTVLTFGDFRLFLGGDAEKEVLAQIQSQIGNVAVMKVPHQGAKKGLDKSLVAALDPEVAVISVGKKNTYGHPSAEILKLLSNQQSAVLRTDEHGTIEIVSDGKQWFVR